MAGDARDLRLWVGLKKAGVTEVAPVLMLWGAGTGTGDNPAVSTVDGVTVVMGPRADEWANTLRHDQLAAEQVRAGWVALDAQALKRDTGDKPLPPSVARMATTAWVTVGTALLGLVACLQLVRLPGGLVTALLLDLVLVGAPVLLVRRVRDARYPVLGWQVGAGCGALLTLAALAVSWAG